MDANQLQIGQRVWVVSCDNRIVEGPITALSAFATNSGLFWVEVSGLVQDSGETFTVTVISCHVFASQLDALRCLRDRLMSEADATERLINHLEKEAA